jgi:DNA-binding NarL/FixJ family response regulator
MVDSFDDIVAKRSLPGILIFNQNQELVHVSAEARNLLNAINHTVDRFSDDPPFSVPDEICQLCSSFINGSPTKEAGRPCNAANISRGNRQYLIRTAPLFGAEQKKNTEQPHIMVFIERWALGRHIDINKIRTRLGLTEREAQIVGEIVKGCTNCEIAGSLCISENTVKDHIKNIMKKLGVRNRTSIFCRVFE